MSSFVGAGMAQQVQGLGLRAGRRSSISGRRMGFSFFLHI